VSKERRLSAAIAKRGLHLISWEGTLKGLKGMTMSSDPRVRRSPALWHLSVLSQVVSLGERGDSPVACPEMLSLRRKVISGPGLR